MIKTEQNNNTITTKARYWVGVGYPENMVENWQDDIGDILELPYAYCIHDKDLNSDGEDRKTHVHIIIAYANTTTYKTALNTFKKLGVEAFNTCEPVNNIRSKYDYLIHDTETCKKKGKHLYDKSERITGNNFDIGSYEQISLSQKKAMRVELSRAIIDQNICNYTDFYMMVVSNYGEEYEDIISSYSGHFERLTKGNYLKSITKKEFSNV